MHIKKLRKSNGIELNNAIIIFDEAHNVERVCEDSASSEISVLDIASSMNEIAYIVEECRNDVPGDKMNPFTDNDHADGDDEEMSNMPATLSELKDLTGENFILFLKNRFCGQFKLNKKIELI